jgi:hypothetical protein
VEVGSSWKLGRLKVEEAGGRFRNEADRRGWATRRFRYKVGLSGVLMLEKWPGRRTGEGTGEFRVLGGRSCSESES